jgi:hypothetical protein
VSRSRRRPRLGKCACGRALVPFLEKVGRRGPANPGCPHPVMEDVAAQNQRFLRFKARRRKALFLPEEEAMLIWFTPNRVIT